jgi:hypothetical protein
LVQKHNGLFDVLFLLLWEYYVINTIIITMLLVVIHDHMIGSLVRFVCGKTTLDALYMYVYIRVVITM